MFLRSFEKLPPELQNDSVRKYYDILAKKRASIFFKRLTDILLALIIFNVTDLVLTPLVNAVMKLLIR